MRTLLSYSGAVLMLPIVPDTVPIFAVRHAVPGLVPGRADLGGRRRRRASRKWPILGRQKQPQSHMISRCVTGTSPEKARGPAVMPGDSWIDVVFPGRAVMGVTALGGPGAGP